MSIGINRFNEEIHAHQCGWWVRGHHLVSLWRDQMTGQKARGKANSLSPSTGISICLLFVCLEFVFVHDVCTEACMHRMCMHVRRLVNFRYNTQEHHPPPLRQGLS